MQAARIAVTHNQHIEQEIKQRDKALDALHLMAGAVNKALGGKR